MPYYTGLANNIGDVMTAFDTALLAEGWSYSSGHYTKGTMSFNITAVSNHIEIRSNVGGGPSTDGAYDGTMSLGTIGTTQLQYPANYYIHIHNTPDEVYLFVNESGDRWSWLAFGKSNVSGLTGPGDWYGATLPHKNNNIASSNIRLLSTPMSTDSAWGFFMDSQPSGTSGNTAQPYNCTINHGLDSNSWSKAGTNAPGADGTAGTVGWVGTPAQARCITAIYPLLAAQPNAWNNQAILLRVQVYVKRASDKFSLVADMEHVRHIRNDNYNDGDILTLGSVKWKIYPLLRKNISARNGASSSTHSGTLALAVRYDGP